MTSVCVVDEEGRIVLEAKAPSDPDQLMAVLSRCEGRFERIGFEAGPLSQWLYFGFSDAVLPAACMGLSGILCAGP
jgi:hypothetical protein